MNKLSMTYEQMMIINIKKKYEAVGYKAQVLPSIHSFAGPLLQSNITLFQSSPVESANNNTNALTKFLKFLFSLSSISPSMISANKKLAMIESIK